MNHSTKHWRERGAQWARSFNTSIIHIRGSATIICVLVFLCNHIHLLVCKPSLLLCALCLIHRWGRLFLSICLFVCKRRLENNWICLCVCAIVEQTRVCSPAYILVKCCAFALDLHAHDKYTISVIYLFAFGGRKRIYNQQKNMFFQSNWNLTTFRMLIYIIIVEYYSHYYIFVIRDSHYYLFRRIVFDLWFYCTDDPPPLLPPSTALLRGTKYRSERGVSGQFSPLSFGFGVKNITSKCKNDDDHHRCCLSAGDHQHLRVYIAHTML